MSGNSKEKGTHDPLLSSTTMRGAVQRSEMRKVFATVKSEVFYEFAARCKGEGVLLGDAFACIVEAYSNGAMLVFPKKTTKKRGVDYVGQQPAREDAS